MTCARSLSPTGYRTTLLLWESVSIDESSLPPVQPEALVQTLTADEIQSVVSYCYEHALPLTVRGAGSDLEGSAIPIKGGIVLDVSRMDKITQLWPEDLQVRSV